MVKSLMSGKTSFNNSAFVSLSNTSRSTSSVPCSELVSLLASVRPMLDTRCDKPVRFVSLGGDASVSGLDADGRAS